MLIASIVEKALNMLAGYINTVTDVQRHSVRHC